MEKKRPGFDMCWGMIIYYIIGSLNIIKNNEMDIYKSSRYKCIVLDLDGTLIHSCNNNLGDGINIAFIDSMGETNDKYWVHKRPGFDMFLDICFKNAVVGVWSTGTAEYVEEIVKLFPKRPTLVFNRDNCIIKNGHKKKYLKILPYQGSVVMIDDRSEVLKKTDRVETLVIPKWNPEIKKDDNILNNILPLLFKEEINCWYGNELEGEECEGYLSSEERPRKFSVMEYIKDDKHKEKCCLIKYDGEEKIIIRPNNYENTDGTENFCDSNL